MSRIIETMNLTKSLVAIPSVNESRRLEDGVFNETVIAEYINSWFTERHIPSFLQNLPDGRKNVFAFVGGLSNKTVVLLGHFDTVNVDKYQALGLPPFDTDQLVREQQVESDKYMAGCGVLDMKSGIANAMVLMEDWHKCKEKMGGSVLFVGTCDEENNSYGILNACNILLPLKGVPCGNSQLEKQAKALTNNRTLDLLCAINLDYTTERYPQDREYHIWNGTIGKLLPSIYVRGKETHVGEHFNGFHASSVMARIISQVEGNMELAKTNMPPTVLKVTDGRNDYSVTTSSSAKAYFNMFSVGHTPSEIMDQFELVINQAIQDLSGDIKRNYRVYCERMGIPHQNKDWDKHVRVIRFSQLAQDTQEKFGSDMLNKLVACALEESPSTDNRDRSFAVVEKLINELKIDDPTIVLFYSPPFYPYVKPDSGKLAKITDQQIKEIGDKYGVTITAHDFYPYISDMSYLHLEPEIEACLDQLTQEMPVWGKGYWLDLNKIKELNLPVVNVGPYGLGVHQTSEKVEKRFSFEILPDIINGIVNGLLVKPDNS